MPANFGTQLSPKQIDDLVAFVYQSDARVARRGNRGSPGADGEGGI